MTVIFDASSRPRHPEKAHRPDAPALKKPDWIRVKAPVSRGYGETRAIARANGLHTVCEEAGCPNIGECWDKKHARLRLLQRQDRRAWPARWSRAGTGRRGNGKARPQACGRDFGRSRRSR